MKTTRRHKIAHSAVIRRVKLRKSEKAKRHKRKTHKRNTRNKVMKGGIHEDLNVYIIHESGKPKCFIIRQHVTFGLDTIYLFFDAQLPIDEFKAFLGAALGLDNLEKIDSIEPQLKFVEPESKLTQDAVDQQVDFWKRNTQEFKSLFVKLSGIRSYTLSSGYLDELYGCNKNERHEDECNISLYRELVLWKLPTHKIPDINGNGEAVITRLNAKTNEKFKDYTFTSLGTLMRATNNHLTAMVNSDFSFKDLRELRNYLIRQKRHITRQQQQQQHALGNAPDMVVGDTNMNRETGIVTGEE